MARAGNKVDLVPIKAGGRLDNLDPNLLIFNSDSWQWLANTRSEAQGAIL